MSNGKASKSEVRKTRSAYGTVIEGISDASDGEEEEAVDSDVATDESGDEESEEGSEESGDDNDGDDDESEDDGDGDAKVCMCALLCIWKGFGRSEISFYWSCLDEPTRCKWFQKHIFHHGWQQSRAETIIPNYR